MPDRFDTHAASLDGPASHGFSISPSDASDLPETTRAIYVGTPGDLAVDLASGANLTFTNLASGTILPVRASAVKATGTSASDLIGLV